MKKYSSVFMLAVRCSIYKILLLFCTLFAVESLLFINQTQRSLACLNEYIAAGDISALRWSSSSYGLEDTFANSHLSYICAAGLLLITLVLLFALRQPQCALTLRRLSINKEAVVGCFALYNALVFFIFWLLQGAVLLLLCLWYSSQMPDQYGGLPVLFLACYQQNVLHAFVPMQDLWVVGRNLIVALCLGICTACGSAQLRLGKKVLALWWLCGGCLGFFATAVGAWASALLESFAAALVASAAIYTLYYHWKEEGEE